MGEVSGHVAAEGLEVCGADRAMSDQGGRSWVEQREGGSKVESTARQAEVELQAWRSDVEHWN